MTKIVRKVDGNGNGIACWLDSQGDLRGWYISATYDTAGDQAKMRPSGWPISASCANAYGTTLAALRAELTEEGEGDA